MTFHNTVILGGTICSSFVLSTCYMAYKPGSLTQSPPEIVSTFTPPRTNPAIPRDAYNLPDYPKLNAYMAHAPEWQMPAHPHLLTREQVASRLGVTAATIHRWEKGGAVTPKRLASGQPLYDEGDITILRLLRHGINDVPWQEQ